MRWSGAYVVSIALTMSIGCGGDGSTQASIDRALQRMRDQPRADAYGSSNVFPDGKVMQTPPPGTIPRERELDPMLTSGRDASGQYLRRMPMPVTAQLLTRGRSRFRVVCGACHGVGGFGGSVVASNFTERRPPALRTGPAAAIPPGQLYEVIQNGFGQMPPYAAALSNADRWAVVAYVLSIRNHAAADTGERQDSIRAVELRRADSLRPDPSP